MSVPTVPTVPAYCRHKPSKSAYVRINGRQIYLGPYGSPESRTAQAVGRCALDSVQIHASHVGLLRQGRKVSSPFPFP